MTRLEGRPYFRPMKPILISAIFILVSLFSFGQKKKQRSILMRSINFYTTTLIAISCENFEKSLSRIEINEIRSVDSIKMLDKYLEKPQYLKADGNLDVRAKLVFTNKHGKVVTICMDNFYASINGKCVDKSSELYKYLRSLIPQKQLY